MLGSPAAVISTSARIRSDPSVPFMRALHAPPPRVCCVFCRLDQQRLTCLSCASCLYSKTAGRGFRQRTWVTDSWHHGLKKIANSGPAGWGDRHLSAVRFAGHDLGDSSGVQSGTYEFAKRIMPPRIAIPQANWMNRTAADARVLPRAVMRVGWISPDPSSRTLARSACRR